VHVIEVLVLLHIEAAVVITLVTGELRRLERRDVERRVFVSRDRVLDAERHECRAGDPDAVTGTGDQSHRAEMVEVEVPYAGIASHRLVLSGY
jgi:hypothetical protein